MRKLFRGSGRILGIIFAASIIWLIFDMAALRFSFTEINSKLSKEEFIRLERVRSKVLQDEELHKMFRERAGRFAAGGGLNLRAGIDGERRALREKLPVSTKDTGGPAKRRQSEKLGEHRVRADRSPPPNGRGFLAPPGTITLNTSGRQLTPRPPLNLLRQSAGGHRTAAWRPQPGQVVKVTASHPAILPGKVKVPVPEVQRPDRYRPLQPVTEGVGMKGEATVTVMAEQVAPTGRESQLQANQDILGKVSWEESVKPAERKLDTSRTGESDTAKRLTDGKVFGVLIPGEAGANSEKAALEELITVNASVKAIDKSIDAAVINDTVTVINDTVKQSDSKISTDGKVWNRTKSELVNITDIKDTVLKLSEHKKTGLSGLTNATNSRIDHETNKTAINHLTGKNQTHAIEKRDFSKIIGMKITAKINETNDQQIDGNVLKHSVVNLDSIVGVHTVLTVDITLSPRVPKAIGQFGQPAVVPKDQEQLAKERWNEGHFNVYLSDMIPLDRALPDTRPEGCADQIVHNNLPTTSIIMCFVDEVWSTLLRSVHSIFNRSPAHLIKEVILVDDFSTKEYLKENLDKYMSHFPKVHVIHLQKRHGLIRARLVGAAIATGDVLTFLDSHVECNVGWLEPLLERILLKRTKVACPVIEVISDEDMSYVRVSGFLRGVFTWPMNFGWKTIPDEMIKKYNLKEMDPIRCPIMAGGLFSIDKKYFYELGTYDAGLEVWGGENMELSFKVWMCGGEIEIIPCSRVGHIFRDGNPYTFPKNKIKTVERNLARVAEVWLDEYVDVFYGHGYHHLLNTNNIEFNIGDLREQKELRKKLQCKNFTWYLENVYPDLQTPLVRADGLLFNVGTRKCLAVENGTLSFELCDMKKKCQHFSHTWLRLIKQMDMCIALLDMKQGLGMKPCDNKNNNLRWLHQSFIAESTLTDHILWEISQFPLCLEGNLFGKTLIMNTCDPVNPHQKWQFTNYYKD
ncbi:LOW QUALITY PROTEIN: polypeptide N-acetylgalactosaminyltransferase 5 [Heptranchias perlo]|uniref:LOW QUALITY PROTEIN: polypeptide N-acetylgalactosaminyltransferase 5 n=1 Tax=Heptranchias perlo TaxID=212740 RepID=UPI003559C2CB